MRTNNISFASLTPIILGLSLLGGLQRPEAVDAGIARELFRNMNLTNLVGASFPVRFAPIAPYLQND